MFNNRAIVEKQETGKTTFLLKEIDNLISLGQNVIVLDSATDHVDKSLLKKVLNKYDNCIEVTINDENLIDISEYNIKDFIQNYHHHFPFDIICENKNKIICFDLSFFLEKGHDMYDKFHDEKLYKYYRKLYNDVSQQIALIAILCDRDNIIKTTTVVTDEIEFPIVDFDISLLQKNINFLSSVHPENAFGTFYESFEKIKFKVYKRGE